MVYVEGGRAQCEGWVSTSTTREDYGRRNGDVDKINKISHHAADGAILGLAEESEFVLIIGS